jgi:hydroxyacylglutathione hydrolase
MRDTCVAMDVFTIPGRHYDSNIYIVVGELPTIIDTGTGFYTQEIIKTIETIIKLPRIRQILLTHEHYDHVGGVQEILKTTKGAATIFAHQGIIAKLNEGKSTFAEMLGGVMPKIKVDVPLSDNTALTVGDHPFSVLFTPGHSVGSLCFYNATEGILFSGDTIFANGGFGRYDFPGGDFHLLLQSIERLSSLHVKTIYPGHGPIVESNGADHVLQALCGLRSLI